MMFQAPERYSAHRCVVSFTIDSTAECSVKGEVRTMTRPEVRQLVCAGALAGVLIGIVTMVAARPHHLGSPYGKQNAEWILARFKEWGWDASIESYDVLFPTPKERVVELLGPTPFKATLQEPPVSVDPTSSQQAEQLPSFNAYSIDGDVTGPLVYVNY